MLKLDPFVFCCNNAPTRDPLAAFDMAKEFGFRRVELCAIDGLKEQIVAEKVNDEYVDYIRNELEKRSLTGYSLAAHGSLANEKDFARFMKKMEFAAKMNMKLVNTRCDSKEATPELMRNIRTLIGFAEKYGITVNLESYGDICGSAQVAYPFFQKIDHPLIRYNYDPGNLLRYSLCTLDCAKDIPANFAYLNGLHLKDSSVEDGYIVHPALGKGSADYPALFAVIEKKFPVIQAGLEVPAGFRCRISDFAFELVDASFEKARRQVRESLDYLKTICEFTV